MSNLRRITARLSDWRRVCPVSWLAVCVPLLVAVSTARAVDVLTVRDLVSHCDQVESAPDGAHAQYCVRYIQGFIDGAVATDVRVMLNIEAGSGGEESFTQRAKRTRAPNRADWFRAAQLAGFCLGDPLPLREVVGRVAVDLGQLNVGASADYPAREAVYQSLQDHYPCGNE
jgi:hypothetical protein